MTILSVLVITVLLAACPASERRPPQPAPSAPDHVLAGPLNGRTGAWLTLGDAASRVRVYLTTLPGLLYRISTGPDSGVAPVVSRQGGRVTVRLRSTDGDGLDEVRIVLNRNVRWDIRLPAGAGEQQLHLREGRVARVDLGASGLAELWLPDPSGTVPVTFTGGTGTALLTAETDAPFRIRFREGAGSVRTPWSANNGTAAGTVLRERHFAQVADRYVIRAEGGLGRLVLRRTDPGTTNRVSANDPSAGRRAHGEPGDSRPPAGRRVHGELGGSRPPAGRRVHGELGGSRPPAGRRAQSELGDSRPPAGRRAHGGVGRQPSAGGQGRGASREAAVRRATGGSSAEGDRRLLGRRAGGEGDPVSQPGGRVIGWGGPRLAEQPRDLR